MDIQTKSITQYLYYNVDKLIDDGKLNNKFVVIFGANQSAMLVTKYLLEKGITVDAVVDNNKQKRDMIAIGKLELFAGKYQLCSPQEVLGEYKENALILIASQCYHDMCTQITQMGYDAEKQTIQLLSFPKISREQKPGIRYINQDEMKKIELDLLVYFRDLCEKLGLRYYLCGGTLLGAVRHKGYIPWDDDIDVFMPYPDYVRLIELFEEDDVHKLINMDNCETSYMFTRLIDKRTVLEEIHYPLLSKTRINIDIFPISGFPNDEKEAADFTTEILELRSEWDNYWIMYGTLENHEELYVELKSKIKNVMARYDFDESDVVGYIATGKFDRELLARNNFDDSISINFENIEFKTLKGYDVYLTNMYGDYMKLPPEEQQESKHDFMAWWEI